MSEVRENIIKLSNGKVLILSPLDANKLLLDTSSVAFLEIERNADHEIIAIDLEGKQTIHIGDSFSINIGDIKSIYVARGIMISQDEKAIIIISSLINKTSIFLLPLLGKSKLQLKYSSYFENAYLSEDLECLHVRYRFTGTKLYKDFEQKMITDPLCVTHMESDPYHVDYVFKIPKGFSHDVEYFVEGKYSQFSKNLRQRIARFYGNDDASGAMKVINKDESLREDLEEAIGMRLPKNIELASRPDMKQEIYK